MKKFEYLEKTADAKFLAYGKTLEEAFSNSAEAMFNIMVKTDTVGKKIKKTIEIKSENLDSLMYDWLEHLLVLVDTERFLLNKAKVFRISKINGKYLLKAVIYGDEISDKYEIFGEVKAVTYNEMEIAKKDEHWQAQVVLDI